MEITFAAYGFFSSFYFTSYRKWPDLLVYLYNHYMNTFHVKELSRTYCARNIIVEVYFFSTFSMAEQQKK